MEDVPALQADRAWRYLGSTPKPTVLGEVLVIYLGFCAAFLVVGIVHGLLAGFFAGI